MSGEARKTITLELLLAGDGLSGRAVDGDGARREFSGRLGLMHAIDELLDGAGSSAPSTDQDNQPAEEEPR